MAKFPSVLLYIGSWNCHFIVVVGLAGAKNDDASVCTSCRSDFSILLVDIIILLLLLGSTEEGALLIVLLLGGGGESSGSARVEECKIFRKIPRKIETGELDDDDEDDDRGAEMFNATAVVGMDCSVMVVDGTVRNLV